MEPDASTVCLATKRHTRCRGWNSGGTGKWSFTRSTAPYTPSSNTPNTVVRGNSRTSGSERNSAIACAAHSAAGSVDGVAFCEATATKHEILVGENHSRTGSCSRQRSGQTRRTGANHQHVAMRPALLVVVGIGIERGRPRPAARRIIGS